MRLVFPGQELEDVQLRPGMLTLGASPQCDVSLPARDWLPQQARLCFDPQRGIWLEIEPGAVLAHVNARPVRECALLRAGDLVALGDVRFQLCLDDGLPQDWEPPAAGKDEPQAGERTASSRIVLRGLAGAFHGRALPLVSSLSIGRDPKSDVVLDGDGIVRQHARLEVHSEGIVLRAQGRGNEARLNGLRVENAMLYPGDQLVFGTHRFVLEAPGLPGRHAPRPHLALHPPIEPETKAPAPATAADEESAGASRFGAWWLLVAAAAMAGLLTLLLNSSAPG